MATLPVTQDVTQDAAPVAPGVEEELAGPPHVATAPIARAERISTIDTLRGFALMGILLMNIHDFGAAQWNYWLPLAEVKPVFSGPHWLLNTSLWFFRWIFAEGKMRALFSMLFGAGVLLMTGRAEARGAGVRTADIFLRRNLWLIVIGALHCYLVWNGDILLPYGLVGVLLLFPMRNLKPRTLLWTGGLVLFLYLAGGIGVSIGRVKEYHTARQAYAARDAHRTLTVEQKKAIDEWDKHEGNFRHSDKEMYEDIAKHQKGYVATRIADAKDSYEAQTLYFITFMPDVLGMMLIGMALYRNGFFIGRLSNRFYGWTAAICLGVAWPLVGVTCWIAWHGHFDMLKTNWLLHLPYDLGRVGGAIGNAALLILLIKHGVGKWIMARIAAVGQMALSNYLLTSISLQALFVWSPLHWYGYFDYYKLYLVVLCMWAVNLAWSTVWLRHFQFGPAEWLWRSLTYWKRQPMRIAAS